MRRSTIPRTRRWGITMALATTVISGFAVYLNGFGVREWAEAGASAATYTTAKNLVSAAVLVVIAVLLGASGFRDEPRRAGVVGGWRRRLGLVTVAVVGGSVPFLLFFEGLARASSTQAAVLHKSLVLWVVLLAVPLLRERIGVLHVAAVALIVSGQVVMSGGVSGLGLGGGEVMVLAATVMWAVEVVVAKRLLGEVSALSLGVVRMGAGAAVLVLFVAVTGRLGELAALSASQWLWVLATGAVLALYVATWYLGLARAQAVDVTAVLVFAAVITAVLDSGLSGAALPSLPGLGLVATGAALTVAAMARRTAAR